MLDVTPMNASRAASAARLGGRPAGQAAATKSPATSAARRAGDTVDISALARAATGQVREALVERVRSEIADGSYITDDKLAAAADAILREINR